MNGEFRIIDGYRSQYVQAEFKEGMFDGKYQEYSHNALRREGSYKEGRKNGLFREYVGGHLPRSIPSAMIPLMGRSMIWVIRFLLKTMQTTCWMVKK